MFSVSDIEPEMAILMKFGSKIKEKGKNYLVKSLQCRDFYNLRYNDFLNISVSDFKLEMVIMTFDEIWS